MGCVGSSRKVKPDPNANEIYPSKTKSTYDGKIKTPMRGDVTQRVDARKDRERRIKDRQQKMAFAAEEMSSKVMDERERLSLSTRATSRATSRTSSPTLGARKHVQFKDGQSGERGGHVCKQTQNNKDNDSMNGPISNGIITNANGINDTSKTPAKDDSFIIGTSLNGGKLINTTVPAIIVNRTSESGKDSISKENVPMLKDSPVRKTVAVT